MWEFRCFCVYLILFMFESEYIGCEKHNQQSQQDRGGHIHSSGRNLHGSGHNIHGSIGGAHPEGRPHSNHPASNVNTDFINAEQHTQHPQHHQRPQQPPPHHAQHPPQHQRPQHHQNSHHQANHRHSVNTDFINHEQQSAKPQHSEGVHTNERDTGEFIKNERNDPRRPNHQSQGGRKGGHYDSADDFIKSERLVVSPDKDKKQLQQGRAETPTSTMPTLASQGITLQTLTDFIIRSPVRDCPPGYRVDWSGNCRPAFY